jgi:methyl-accepting chemotaxis protein
MNKVVASIHHVQAIMGEVDQATLRQGQSIAEINQAIVEMDDMTRQNAALVGQAGAASDSLRQQIAALTGAAGNFKTSPSGVPAASATDTRAVAGATTFPPLSSSITT